MRNKIGFVPSNKSQKLFDLEQQQQIRLIKPAERIFPPPNFLFDGKGERLSSQKNIIFHTRAPFKPKLQIKMMQRMSGDNKTKTIERSKQINSILKQDRLINNKTDKLVEGDIETLRSEMRMKLRVNMPYESQHLQSQLMSKHASESQQISRSTKYSTSKLLRRDDRDIPTKGKMLYGGRYEYISELDSKVKKSLSVRLEELDAKLSEITSQNMLEVMTIYSIKEQKKEKSKQVKHNFIKKKQMFESLAVEKRYRSLYKKKAEFYEQEGVDISADKVYFKKIYSYMCFLRKVNFSNNMQMGSLNLKQRYNNEKVKVYVGNGNNRNLIVGLLKRRFWLEVTNKIGSDTKFVWTQNSIKDIHAIQRRKKQKFAKIQKVKTEGTEYEDVDTNALLNPESLKQIDQKMFLNRPSLIHTFTSLNSSPPKFSLKLQKLETIKNEHNKKLFMNQEKGKNAERLLRNSKLTSKRPIQQQSISKLQIITNHIPHNSFIGSKKALFYTMQHYYRNVKQIDPFTVIPKTYHFKSMDDEAYNIFLQEEKQVNQKGIWIVKPGECTNRGNGIYLMKAADVTRRILKRQFHENGQTKTTIVQSYITNPLLYHGRKFDIRHYMMITIVNGNLKAYWYSEGYLRTSSEYFSLDNLNNHYIHLTNDAIQKTSEKYGKYEAGNKLSYMEFQRYLDSTYHKSKIDFRKEILPVMREIAKDVVKANYMNLDRERRMNNFEIFGLDFMIDNKFKPWLIEVNANPCLEISCHLLSRIIPLMVEHSLRVGLDPLLMPPSHFPPATRYYLSDNFIQNLKYEIIFDELEEKQCQSIKLNYDFQFDEPQDEYENQGAEIDLSKILA